MILLAPLLALVLSPPPDRLSLIMLALVAFIAIVIDRYAARYLDGQTGKPRYRRWFFATVLAVSCLTLAHDLRLLALAWTASSLSLHQLLNFFPDRGAAQIAAHKKFLLSRLADVAIYSAVFLFGRSLGTYDIAELAARAAALATLPTATEAAGYLLVAGVVLRSAQLPFHGWLIQVMEAPTPVSALLHAGVVNIGGFVMIRTAALIGPMSGPQTVLVLFGATTAAVAGLVMMTRVSVKVALAWSTAAQMGFMLMECGLGAYELALLHLVAHSCYKAHAFLSSGSVVSAQANKWLAPAAPRSSLARWSVGAAGGALVAWVVAAFAWPDVMSDSRSWVAVGILALSLAPLFAAMTAARGLRQPVLLFATALGIAVLYAGWHLLVGRALAIDAVSSPDRFRILWALGVFATLYVVQALVSARPQGVVARRLYPWAFGGFHLDEYFSRATFLIWPPKHARRAAARLSVASDATAGAR